MAEVMHKMKAMACTVTEPKRGEQMIEPMFRWQANKIVMCCGIDTLSSVFIDYGTHELHEMLSLSLNASRLNKVSKRKAQLLFQFGEDFAYGAMFRSSFVFKPFVTHANDLVIQEGVEHIPKDRPPFYFGMHLRHSSMDDKFGMEHGETPCMEKLIKDLLPEGRSCVILVATDRPEKVAEYKRTNFKEGCKVIFSNHSLSPAVIINRIEHGPFTGPVAMCDLELLSRSDVFLGSSYTSPHLMMYTSTFSMLMAALRASSGLPTALKYRSYWLPSCGPMVGARTEPDPFYNDPHFQCGKHTVTKIDLTSICPYFDKDENDLPLD